MLLNGKFLLKNLIWKSKDMQEKVSIMDAWCGQKNPSLGITVQYHEILIITPMLSHPGPD